MKNLILFTTKYGSVENASLLLKGKLKGETTIINLKKDSEPDIMGFDNVILGGSMYVGKIQKEMTAFVNAHLDKLLQKQVALFICAGEQGETLLKELKSAFPEALYAHAISIESFGQEVHLDKMNFFEKLVLRLSKNVTESYSKLSEENITKLAEAVNRT